MPLSRAALLLPALMLAACEEPEPPPHLRIAGAVPERGVEAIGRHGCGACHTIPGIRSARGKVGPPLDDFAMRGYVAGVVPNWPRHLVAWIMDPPSLSPRTAMPNLGVSEAEARDIAAYLYTLGAEEAAVFPPEPWPAMGGREATEAMRGDSEWLLNPTRPISPEPDRTAVERAGQGSASP